VERHVVLAHELDIAHIPGALVGAPPALPGIRIEALRLGPFGAAGDVFDGRVEPDIEDLAFHPRPVRVALPHRNAPVEVAGDAAVLQPVAVMQPFPGDRGGQHRPAGLPVDPRIEPLLHRRLAQVQVLRLAHLQIGGARDRAARVDQVGRVKLLGAVLALVAARMRIAAIRAGPLDIAVGQEPPVGR
jgi:hypothetical protein